MATDTNIKLAVLIDTDNAQPSAANALLAEVAKHGTAFVCHAHGDWTVHTEGKNATDSAMIIDAMDLLYTNRFDGFCLVSSDSDLTRLASRIRESGLVVYGFGERKTPKPFVSACDKFIYFENLKPVIAPIDPPTPLKVVAEPPTGVPATLLRNENRRVPSLSSTQAIDAGVKYQLRMAVETASDDDGRANLAKVGSLMTQRDPAFDHRTYGYTKFSELVAASNLFDISRRTSGEGKAVAVYVRDKMKAVTSPS